MVSPGFSTGRGAAAPKGHARPGRPREVGRVRLDHLPELKASPARPGARRRPGRRQQDLLRRAPRQALTALRLAMSRITSVSVQPFSSFSRS